RVMFRNWLSIPALATVFWLAPAAAEAQVRVGVGFGVGGFRSVGVSFGAVPYYAPAYYSYARPPLAIAVGPYPYYPPAIIGYTYNPAYYGVNPRPYSSTPRYYGVYDPFLARGSSASYLTYTPPSTSSQSFYSRVTPIPSPTQARRITTDSSAAIEVRVPETAQLWFEGIQMNQTSSLRRFASPPLAPDQTYTYTIRVRWTADGKEVTQDRQISVQGGHQYYVDLTAPEKETLPPPNKVIP